MSLNNFTEPIIKGINFKKMMPKGTALVLEGGGARAYYSAGVFEAFMDSGIMFPYIAGVSAGSANALSYVSGQRGRNRIIAEKYVKMKTYASLCNYLRTGSYFDFDFIFKSIPEKHVFWDKEMFDSADIRFLTGAINCATGETVWFEKEEIATGFTVSRASCSIPVLSRIVKHNGYDLLDGGISSPIPIEKSIADGNTFHVIVLTRNRGFVDEPYGPANLLKLFYRKYPNLIETAMRRHDIYNRQLALCEQLERDNKALIIRPHNPLTVEMLETNPQKLLMLYDEGHREGLKAIHFFDDIN